MPDSGPDAPRQQPMRARLSRRSGSGSMVRRSSPVPSQRLADQNTGNRSQKTTALERLPGATKTADPVPEDGMEVVAIRAANNGAIIQPTAAT